MRCVGGIALEGKRSQGGGLWTYVQSLSHCPVIQGSRMAILGPEFNNYTWIESQPQVTQQSYKPHSLTLVL